MTSGWTPGLDEVPTEVRTAIRDHVLATADGLGQEAVLWLAAPPLWTLGIAEAAGFPASPLIEFVRRACDAGWCKARGPLLGDPSPDLVFWMPDEARRAAVDELRARNGSGWVAAQQRRVASGVAQVMLELTTYSAHGPPTVPLPGGELPGGLVTWVQLMEAASRRSGVEPGPEPTGGAAADLGALLFTRTKEAVAAGDLGRAQDLLAAGEAIAGVLTGPAEQALDQARRMVTLGLRRRQDERALGRYLDRPELSGAVDRLLERHAAGEGRWALHLRGAGGVGKTMLIKYLASGRYAADRRMTAFPVVRADFDYISPDYPLRRPVQLLLELTDELVLHTAANTRADRALAVFRARAARAHEAASGRREAYGSPLLNEETAAAVDSFGDVLAQLGDVLLVLDTCEELAKADLGDPHSPRVRAMLDTIERLHKRAPSARVLLAGRRPLDARPYLAVQEVDGFTQDEAWRFLAVSRRRPPPELAEEMIRQSPAVDGRVPPPGELPERVSPFDLALYAAWAEDDPDLDVAEVRRGSDAYVEGRIISRLGDPLVVQALPLLAAAGRCRVATLAEVLDCDPAVLGRRLTEQEWIDAGGHPVVDVAARPTLVRSLRRYFGSDERRTEFAARTAALGAVLLTRLRQVPLAEIDPDELVAALRLAEPAGAAALWDSIADHATEPPGHWGTVLGLTRRILREWEEEEWPTTAALRATVSAAYIAASRRDSDLFDARDSWEAVRAWADRHPDPALQWRLLGRAVLGLLPCRPEDESLWESIDATLSPRLPPDRAGLAAAAADAGHRLLEAGQVEAARRFSRYLLTELTPKVARRSYAWARIVQARTFAEADSGEAVLDYLLEAQDLAQRAVGPEPSWPDWIPPEDLLARIWIERCLIAPPSDVAVLREWEAYAAEHLDSIDGERLASLCLRIRLRHGPVGAATAARWEMADGYVADRKPSCTAHDLVPPLFVSVAQAWFSVGEAERALALLDRRQREALGSRQDELTVRHAEAATIGLVRRLRLTDRQSVLARLAALAGPGSGEYSQTALGEVPIQAWRAQAVTDGSADPYRRFTTEIPEAWHAWWQTLGPGPNAVTHLLGRSARPSWGPASTRADVADIQADLVEVEQLAPRISDSQIRRTLAEWVQAHGEWLDQSPPPPPIRSAEPHHEVRAAMRMAALAGEDFPLPPRVPGRLLAEMAFEEAELTALRLPKAATRLFLIAALAHQEADDPLGAYLARVSVLLAGPWPDGPADARQDEARRQAEVAYAALSRRLPSVASALERAADAGPWRNWTPDGREDTAWAKAVREATALATLPDSDYRPAELASPAGTTPGPEATAGSAGQVSYGNTVVLARRHSPWFTATCVVLAVLACLAAVVVLTVPNAINPSGTQQGPRGGGASPLPWIAGLIAGLAALAVLLGWYLRKVMRLVSGQGVGAVRLGTLLFDTTASAGRDIGSGEDNYAAHFLVGVRPWRTAPLRARAALWSLIPAVRLARRFGRREAHGYYSVDVASRTRWTDPRPTASKPWWLKGRGTALGLIRVPGSGAYGGTAISEPWERMLAGRLSPDAAGRIEWIRLVNTPPGVIFPSLQLEPAGESETQLVGPDAWVRAQGDRYTVASRYALSLGGPVPAGLLHVIGRAVATSAGPAMEVSSSYPADAVPAVLSVTQLEQPQPAMVILQAEPAPADAIGADPPDDQAEKLRLGAALATDGVPAVLLLPVLPAAIFDELARIITTHTELKQAGDASAQALLTRVRAAVAPHVAPPVLDDIVLFLNVARYRS